ncbi:MAG: hypothetical protein ACYCYE_08880 [Clostridia bacterium]
MRQIIKQIVDNLKEQEYVNAGNVENLRKYIRVKHPNSTGEELSAVFADALHKIIDTRIYQFEEKHRKKIKDDVLRKAVNKKEFSINAAEVFSSCLSLKLHEDNYIDSFTLWINQNQPIPVTAAKVDKLVSSAEQLEEQYIENNLDDIVDEFEATWAEDETLASLGLEIGETDNAVYDIAIEKLIIDEVKEDVPELEYQEVPGNEVLDFEEQETLYTRGFDIAKLLEPIRKLVFLFTSNLKYVKPSMKLVLPAAVPLIIITAVILTDLFSDNRIHALQHQDQGKYANITEDQMDRYMSLESRVLKKLDGLKAEKDLVLLDGLHEELKYEKVDESELKKWLDKKNSMLAEEPYFTAILATSKKYDIHPLLMFAIIGQEQSFVPKTGAAAKKIANNPFNVFGSWEDYNTNIYDSSSLAADTIIKSSRNRPVYMNAIRWINRRYAEDPNWWNGVSKLFMQMEKDIASQK